MAHFAALNDHAQLIYNPEITREIMYQVQLPQW